MRFLTRCNFRLCFLCASLLMLVCSLALYGASATRNATHAASPSYSSIGGSYTSPGPGARLQGPHANSRLTVTLALQPVNAAQLSSLLAGLYDPASPLYHQWLAKGEFTHLFAPSAAQIAQVRAYLLGAGLSLAATSTPFLVQATDTTAQIEAAFRTAINDYVTADGTPFFQNSSAVQVHSELAGAISDVVGLSNTARLHSQAVTTRAAAQSAGQPIPMYGAGPGGSGLTPAQTASLYGAGQVYKLGKKGKGQGATLAVFELSGYTPSDITAYEHRFFGSAENLPLVDINVDGGPVTPACLAGDNARVRAFLRHRLRLRRLLR
jgi:kumamolisin